MTPSTALPTSRAGLLDEVDQLRRNRGAALLDGRKFDGASRLAAVEAALIVQDDAERVGREREIEAAQAAENGRVAALRAAVAAASEAQLEAIGEAQAAFRFCADQLGRAIDLVEEIRVAGVALRAPGSLALDRRQVETRISQWIAGELSKISAERQSLGVLEWWGVPMPCESWAQAERDASGPALAMLLSDPAEIAQEPAEQPAEPLNDAETTTDEGDE